jgi:predicted anti-sigma-YlaC factor YlaD
MRCWDARKHVSDYLDGVLESPTAVMVQTHLSVCPTCPPLYAALVDAHAGLADHRDPDSVIPPVVRKRILVASRG